MTLVASDGRTATFDHAAAAVAAALELREQMPTTRLAVLPAVDARRAERLHEIAHPGQIVLLARAAAELDALPTGVQLRDLGIHRLRDLSPPERLFAIAGTGSPAHPPLASLDATPNNLPVMLTSLVGRDREVAAVRSLLASERLVTIAGAGGCGKTRLAAQVGALDVERWRDGVWFVELQSIGDPALVADAVASAVGALVEPVGGARRSVTAQLRDRRALVILDNCEHVLDAAAELVGELLVACPDTSVLATSREPLGIAGEIVWRLPALGARDAIDLFVERAARVRAGFTADDDNAAALQRLAWGLDGIPLAIELAAAWARTLTPQQIEAGLDDRFALLVRSSRGAASRHQTLEASIDWSYALLTDVERSVFRRLAVFSGEFTLDAARAVNGDLRDQDTLSALDGLVAKSLVVADEGDGEIGFRMLDTIRAYARRKLEQADELSAARDRHLDHLLGVAEGVEPLLDTDKDGWRAVIEPRIDDLRSALDWGLAADDAERGRRLATTTSWMWNLHGRGGEGVSVLRRAISRDPDDRSLLQARLLTGFALIGDTAAPADLDPVRKGAEIAAELGDERLRGRCLTLTAVGTFYDDFDGGWSLCDEARQCAEIVSDQNGVDMALGLQGLILHLRDRQVDASALLAPVLARMIRRGERGIASTLLVYESAGAWYRGDAARATHLAGQAVHEAEPLGDYHRVGTTRAHQALLLGLTGDIDGGLELLRRFLPVVEGAGPEVFVPGMARTIGLLHLWRGEPGEALRWFAPDAVAAGPIAGTHLDLLALPALAEALRLLGRTADAAAVLDRAEELVGSIGVPRILAEVLEQRALLVGRDDPDRSADLHHRALTIRIEHRLRALTIPSLEALVVLLAPTGRAEDAARLIAAASAARDAIGFPRRPIDAGGYQRLVAELTGALGGEAFAQLWAAGAELPLDDAVAYVRRTRGQRGRPSSGWASLTPTELEVVGAVVDGLTNPQIGAKLFMSRGTVKTHLSHVFTKLGVSNRTELATYAAPRLPSDGGA